MSIEEYVKQQLASQGISLKDAADVLGYATQSFRNKLARHSLNVHDIFMLSMMFEQKLMITDKHDTPLFLFDRTEYMSKEDDIRLTTFRDKRANKQDFGQWLYSLDKKDQQLITQGLRRTKQEMLELLAKKSSEGTHEIPSENFTHIISIMGVDCDAAAEWLSEKIKGLSPQDEFINYLACERLFDVYIWFKSTASDYFEI